MIDAKTVADIKQKEEGDRAYLQHLALQTTHGAGAWLTALPAEGGLRLDPPSFRVTIARRLRLAVQPEDGVCPRCGGTMDRFGDHALVCACAGDRTRRHNAVRNITHEYAKEGGLGPEKEKAGLLPQSPVGWGLGAARHWPREGGPREKKTGGHLHPARPYWMGLGRWISPSRRA